MEQCWQDQKEWLETDGLGGFASGTAGGIRTRRYHGLLLSATAPPTGRFMLVNGVEAIVTTAAGSFPLSSQRYAGQVVAPEGFKHIEAFDHEPWPTWRFRLPDGTLIEQEIFVRHGQPIVAMSWRAVGNSAGVRLSVRPLMSGRDYHALHHENSAFRFAAEQRDDTLTWRPYDSVPAIVARSNGTYSPRPVWYRNFFYQEEWLRGFEATEDLAAPGVFEFDLTNNEATLIFAACTANVQPAEALDIVQLRAAEMKRRNAFVSRLHRAGDQYIVRRGNDQSAGKTIIACYPWFADWGRDAFISIRGLCLATGRFDEARDILASWANHVSRGMLPNRFPDVAQNGVEEPEYNSVDASLWYVIAVCEFLRSAPGRLQRRGSSSVDDSVRDAASGSIQNEGVEQDSEQILLRAVEQILDGYIAGTRHGIGMDNDGLLMCGRPGVQLTWMDSKIGDWVVTPRHGKPVEVQALWLNALDLASAYFPRFDSIGRRGAMSFRSRFWNESQRCLFDVVDDNRQAGVNDPRVRPNQIYAVGGLPLMLLDLDRARAVVDAVERDLLTPIGLRSLAPSEAGYKPVYNGGPVERDSAYHQGTVWPYLIGPFVEAWVRVRGNTLDTRREARARFLEPMLKHLEDAGLGHVSEIADADAPHMPRGCPFQAWSIAELIRLDQVVLREAGAKPPAKPQAGSRHQNVLKSR
ncbi:glycogen debranching enzyme N-terminal domain-containing protein [soil metagenome]